jgi:hypothetical protein
MSSSNSRSASDSDDHNFPRRRTHSNMNDDNDDDVDVDVDVDEIILGNDSAANSGSFSWVNFSLGEDVRSESRRFQDEQWKEAVTDGRVHISHREANQVHAVEFKDAIAQFRTVQCLVHGLDNKRSWLNKLGRELLEIVVNYLLSRQHAKMVDSMMRIGSVSRYFAQFQCKHEASADVKSKYERFEDNSLGVAADDAVYGSFRVCLRKRPLNEFERGSNIYDCIETRRLEDVVPHVRTDRYGMGNHTCASCITAHDGRKARTGRRITMNHRHFFFDRVWNEKTPNSAVCDSEIRRLVEWANAGYNSTLLCFGQTGTGKTYTLNAAMDYVVESLVGKPIQASFIELHGKQGYDLLADRKVVQIRCDEHDKVHIRGCEYITTDHTRISSVDLMKRLRAGLELRSSEYTERNPISSRSHAICIITLLDGHGNDDSGSSIMLVDLAGSERNDDTTNMTRAQHRESAAINSSLMALKKCFKAYQGQLQQMYSHVKAGQSDVPQPCKPSLHRNGRQIKTINKGINFRSEDTEIHLSYRESLLTRILKECFTCGESHRTLIIVTVSPCSVDLMHSVNSIDHVLNMSSRLSELEFEDVVEVILCIVFYRLQIEITIFRAGIYERLRSSRSASHRMDGGTFG